MGDGEPAEEPMHDVEAADCIDCHCGMGLVDGGEWTRIGPLCYGCLMDRLEAVVTEVASVLVQLDELAELWGDEAKFKRCRDRLLGLRLAENLTTGLCCYIFNAGEFIAFTNLHVLEGYLDGAVYEIRQHAWQQENTK